MRQRHLKTSRMRNGMRGDVMHWRWRHVLRGHASEHRHLCRPLRGRASLFTRLYCYSIGVP